jgi:hypothetical protein
MAQILQRGIRRGKTEERIGLALLFLLLAVLVASVVQGIRHLVV